MRFASLALLMACEPSPPVDTFTTPTEPPPVDTGTPPEDTGDGCQGADIQDLFVQCGPDDLEVELTVEAQGLPAYGTLFAQNTANLEVPRQYADEHVLEVITQDEKACTTLLRRTLFTDTALVDTQPDVSTAFSCNPDEDYRAGDVTYLVRLYDEDDNLMDCVVVGDDAVSLIEATNKRQTDPTKPEEIEYCEVDEVLVY